MSRVAVIEFIGPPGCGKTTIARLVEDSLLKLGYKCLDVHEHNIAQREKRLRATGISGQLQKLRFMGDVGLFYVRQPVLIVELARFMRALRSSDAWVQRIAIILMKQAYMTAHLKRLAETERHDVIIFDQSILQSLWSILLETPKLPEKESRRLLSALRPYIAPVVIRCRLDSGTSYHRMINRKNGWSRLDDMDKRSALDLLDNRISYFPDLARLVQEVVGCDIYVVDTGQDKFIVRDRIVEFLARRIGSGVTTCLEN